MKRNTYYFPHDYNARHDPKLQKLLMKHGQEGKGIYWDLIEMLYEQEGYLSLSECETYAFELRTSYDRITDVIRNSGLFLTDENVFWSESVLDRIKARKDKSESARNSVAVRWSNTNVKRTKRNRNTNKGNNIEIEEGDKKIEFSTRISEFSEKVMQYQNSYSVKMIEKFISYWTEPNKTRTKMRWEQEKFFDLPRRLATWDSREKDFSNGASGSPTDNIIVSLKKPISSDTI